jgi:hypothetical protein
MLLREPGTELRVEYDQHVEGLFSEETWRRLLEDAGLDVLDLAGLGVRDPFEGEHAVFVARRRSS